MLQNDDIDSPSFFISKWKKTLELNYNDLVEEPWEEFILENDQEIKGIKDTITTVSKDLKSPEEFLEKLSVIQKLYRKPIDKKSLSAFTIKNNIQEVKNAVYDELSTTLNNDEFIILGLVQALLSSSKWIEYNNIKIKASNQGFDEDRLMKAFNGLMSKKYIQQGFTLM